MDAKSKLVEIEREISAPRALVFRLWSKPEHLVRWFAPRRCALEIHAFDFRVGGEFRSTIREPDGSACDAVATFVEIVPERKIAYRIRARKVAEQTQETTVTVTFEDSVGGTLLRLHQTLPEALARQTGAYPSWLEMLDRLGEEACRTDGATPQLELFYHPLASFCWKVLIGLYENDTPFVPRQVDLMDNVSSADFFALWPVGKMPLLRDGTRSRVVPETTIILEYLDARYPGRCPLFPTDADLVLEARLWDRFFDLYVQTPMQKIVGDRLRLESERDAKGVAEARASLRTAYDLVERRMTDRAWVVGDAFSLADCAAAPALFYASIVEPFGPTRSAANAYLERLLARSSFARVVTEAKPYFENFPYVDAMPARFR